MPNEGGRATFSLATRKPYKTVFSHETPRARREVRLLCFLEQERRDEPKTTGVATPSFLGFRYDSRRSRFARRLASRRVLVTPEMQTHTDRATKGTRTYRRASLLRFIYQGFHLISTYLSIYLSI